MKTIVAILFTCTFFQLAAQSDEQRKKSFNLKNDVALAGYDPVSYFEGKPTEGKSSFKISYQGVIYLFSSKNNFQKFKANPSNYEPAYGGWCAYAMGQNGEKVKVDPETYKITDGKLYLFYNFWGSNTLNDWNKNERELKRTGDVNWQKYLP
jgi:YHS domain-containing protein